MDKTFAIKIEAGAVTVPDVQGQVLKCRGNLSAILSAPYVLSDHPSTAEEYAVRMINDLSGIIAKLSLSESSDIGSDSRFDLLTLISPEFELLKNAPKHLLEDILIVLHQARVLSENDRMYKTLLEKPLSSLISGMRQFLTPEENI